MLYHAIRNGPHSLAIKVEGGVWNEGLSDQIHGPGQTVIPCGQAAHQPPGSLSPSAIHKGLALKPACTVFLQAQTTDLPISCIFLFWPEDGSKYWPDLGSNLHLQTWCSFWCVLLELCQQKQQKSFTFASPITSHIEKQGVYSILDLVYPFERVVIKIWLHEIVEQMS